MLWLCESVNETYTQMVVVWQRAYIRLWSHFDCYYWVLDNKRVRQDL